MSVLWAAALGLALAIQMQPLTHLPLVGKLNGMLDSADDEAIAIITRGASIVLFDGQGPICPYSLKRAIYVSHHPLRTTEVEGCWLEQDGYVFLGFVDGDSFRIEVRDFTWKEARRPRRPSRHMRLLISSGH